MKFLHLILSLIISLLLITACNTSDKNDKQSGTDESKDTLSAVDESSFLFLTEWFGKTGVYSYNLAEKKYSPVWWHPRENVVMLVYKPGE